MKRIFVSLIYLCLTVAIFAQSDFQITQNFKTKAGQLETSINSIASIDECDKILVDLSNLRKEFAAQKDLLDKALYPETFESTIGKLNIKLQVQRDNFTTISNLEIEVTDLRGQVDILNRQNETLIGQIRELKKAKDLDAEKIKELESKVAYLGSAIRKRDQLVKTLVDSLLNEFVNLPAAPSDYERKNLTKKVNSKNLFYNVERTIKDNIDFLDLKPFKSADIKEIKTQKNEFTGTWQKIGPELTKFYLGDKAGDDALANINSLFGEWDKKINKTIWDNINSYFVNYDIKLLPFNNGSEFSANVLAHITLNMNEAKEGVGDLQIAAFNTFADSVWYREINPNWLPMLEKEKYISSSQRIGMESKIAEWALLIEPGIPMNLIYITCGVALLLFFWVIFRKYLKKK